MRRRDFLAAGAGALAAGGVAPAALGQQGGTVAVGGFLLRRAGPALSVAHSSLPERVLWETDAEGDFLFAERAAADNRVRGTPEGSFDIMDAVADRWEGPAIGAVAPDGAGVAVTGRLGGARGIGYRLAFREVAPGQLQFTASTDAPAVNRIGLRLASRADEGFYGFGQQLTYFDQKGHLLPILVQEHGIGRGRAVVTRLLDVLASRGGGSPFVTECPAPHFITSRLRSMFLENLEYSTFDLRQADHFDVKVWSGEMVGRIVFGRTPLDLIETYTAYAGRMQPLPDWVHGGIIAGLQGGTAVVRGKLATLRKAEVPLAGVSIQDWTGVRTTEVGTQLWWDWRLDESHYPGWNELVAEVAADGGRVLTYVNPFLCRRPPHDSQFDDALAGGYLVRRADGAPYLIRNTTFDAGLLDLSNPEARTWIKGIIRDEMIGRTGASGWMNDFGEALPFDAALADGDPAAWHNRYPEEWARVSREAAAEAGRDDILFFDRSGFTQSPGIGRAFWLGDQMQSWDEYDGIKTAVVGLLSGGVSGFSLLHSDVGGYVVLKLGLDGRQIPIIARTPELLMRWMELNAFTAIFRTHEGLDPAVAAQFDTNAATLAQLVRFGRVYRGLGGYRKRLEADAAARGHPLLRHPFLHYPDDTDTGALRYQFLLGPDLMVAPVLDQGATTVDVYFPDGSAWNDLWSGAAAGRPGAWATIPAPIGRPAVFLRRDAAAGDLILRGLRAEGVLD